MAAISILKSDRNNIISSKVGNKTKSVKLNASKSKLKVNEVDENQGKTIMQDAKCNFDLGDDIFGLSDLPNKCNKYSNIISKDIVNRNKICQMNNIMSPNYGELYVDMVPGPRCLGTESLSYLARNRRSTIVLSDSVVEPNLNTVYCVRCPSTEAIDNLERSRSSRMMNVLRQSFDQLDTQTSPTVRNPKAVHNFKKNKTDSMTNLLNPSRDIISTVIKEPRCPTLEARSTRERSLGQSMSSLMDGSSYKETIVRPLSWKKKVKDKNGDNINPLESVGVNDVLHHKVEPYSMPHIHARVKPEGEKIALKNRGTLTNDIYHCNESVDSDRRALNETTHDRLTNATKEIMRKFTKLPEYVKPKARKSHHSIKKGTTMNRLSWAGRRPHYVHRDHSTFK